MRMKFLAVLFFGVALLTASTASARESTINCHCFKDRSYDPEQPHKVTDYLLATTHNSFFAQAFALNKADVVRARMGGIAGEDLWLVHYLSEKSGIHTRELMDARADKGFWSVVIRELSLPADTLGPQVQAIAQQGGDDAALAAAVADETAGRLLAVEAGVLKSLRDRGAGTQQVLLAVFLSRQTGRPAGDIFAEVQAQKTTWGEVLASTGLTPAQIEPEIVKLMQ